MRNIATADPMTTGTAFALASISKTFTAAVVLQLVEEGKLSLDQPVAPLLPAFGLDRRITVRMLLDHTSGLPDFFLGKGIDAALRAAPAATWTAARAWSYVPKPHAVPGRSWIYSNTNYMLLGQLVEVVTGDPLAREIRARLLDPLGLGTAWYQAVEAPLEAGTLAYSLFAKPGGGFRAVPVARMSGVMPFRSVVTAAGGAGSIAATALDAARWIQAWAGGKVLVPEMQQAMLADIARTVKLHAAIPYGLGIQRVTLGGWTALGHSGRYLGIRNVVRYLPAAGLTIAVLTNQSAWDPSRVATALLKVVAPPPTPAPSASPGALGLAGRLGLAVGPASPPGPSASPTPGHPDGQPLRRRPPAARRPPDPPVRPRPPLRRPAGAAWRAQRLRLHPARGEAVRDLPGDGLLEQALDAAQQVGLVDADEADRVARGPCPPGPADAVDVVLGVPRQLEVDDVGQVLDVEPAGRDVGRHQDPDLAGLEPVERLGPVGLRPVASGSPSAAMPCRSSQDARRAAISLVRVKTSTWRQSPSTMRWASSSSLRSRSTG